MFWCSIESLTIPHYEILSFVVNTQISGIPIMSNAETIVIVLINNVVLLQIILQVVQFSIEIASQLRSVNVN